MARTILRRALPMVTPEALLMVDVIVQAINDGRPQGSHVTQSDRADALRFFANGRVDLYAGLCGIDGDWVREVAQK